MEAWRVFRNRIRFVGPLDMVTTDQVSRVFRPCAAVFLCLGLVPRGLLCASKKWSTVLRFICVVPIIVFVVYICYIATRIISDGTSGKSREISGKIIGLSDCVSCTAIIVIFQVKSGAIGKVFVALNNVNVSLSLHERSGKRLQLCCYLLLLWFVQHVTTNAVLNVVALIRFKDSPTLTNIFLVTWYMTTIITYAVVPIYVIYISYVIATAFDDLNERISVVMTHVQRSHTNFDNEEYKRAQLLGLGLEFINDRYDELVLVTADVSRAFGLSLVIHFLQFGVYMIYTAFNKLMMSDLSEYAVAYVADIIILLSIIVMVVVEVTMAGRIPGLASKHHQALIRIPFLNVRNDHKDKIRLLIQQMSAQPVQITAGDLFPLTRPVLTSFFSAIATYLVILTQFSVSERSSQANCTALSS